MSARGSTQSAESWSALAGPEALGRSLLVQRGAAIPSPWARAIRVHLDDAAVGDRATLLEVRRTFFARTRVVYEVDGSLSTPGWGVAEDDVWDLDVDFDFVAEAVWRLVRANSIDARVRERPVWPLAAMAVDAGAVMDETRHADVRLPDGRLAWCDGGPLHLWAGSDATLDGGVVVPRVAVARGRLAPVAAHPPDSVLAPDQLRAVRDPAARARIIAPAGSGKTRVLVERARHVLRAGVPADAVTLVAFNRRAREEMRERTRDLPELRIQTLNALALSILNGTSGFVGLGTTVRTIAERDVRAILGQYVKFPRRANTDPAAAWIDALSQVRLGLQSPTDVERAYGGDLEGFAEFFPLYRRHLAEHRLVDFDEQVFLALETLLRDPRVRVSAESRGEVLLVDEFQDLTPAHMLLLRLLAGPQLPIFAVGDDDQTIYGYSGATPEGLVRFEDHVPEAVHHALEVNYRCPAPVVTAATNLLSRNPFRVAKSIRPGPANERDPGSLVVAHSDDQVEAVIEHVRALLAGGALPADIAVLTRVNVNLAPIQVALTASDIPVDVRDDGSFVRNAAVESALAWMRLATRPDEMAGGDLELAARRPGRGISPRVRSWMGEQGSLEGLRRLARRLDVKESTKVGDFVADLGRATELAATATTAELIEFVRRDVGLDRSLATLDASHQGRNGASVSDGLRSLAALGRRHDDPSTFDRWLTSQLAVPSDGDGVTLATVHRVKGLEWPHVVVYDASADVVPHRLSVDYDEERRIFHVAITRCTRSLLITAQRGSPSLFLSEFSGPLSTSRGGRGAGPAREARRAGGPARAPRAGGGARPLAAVVGTTFTWGGHEFTVRAVEVDGVVVSTGDSRATTLPLGWTFWADGETRTLVAPSGRRGRTPSPPREVDAALYDALKAWRREQARADGVPAYVVFSDRTLEELSRVRPRRVDELLGVSGIGPAKAERYGDQILAVIGDAGGS